MPGPRVKNTNVKNNVKNNNNTVKKNTSGLEKFGKARDAVLVRHGIPDLTAAIRKEYDSLGLKGFDGWRTARDVALKNYKFPDGYKSLLDEAKREFSKL